MNKYKLIIEGAAPIACTEYHVDEVYFTARILSKYSHCRVDVHQHNQFIQSFDNGKRVSFINNQSA